MKKQYIYFLMMKRLRYWCFIPTIVVMMVHAADEPKHDFSKIGRYANRVAWAKRIRQGFGMPVWMSNEMIMGNQAATGVSDVGLDFPAGSNNEHLFGGGPIIGGIVDG